MAITTLDQIIAGLLPPIEVYKAPGGTQKAIGTYHSPLYVGGMPGAATPSSAGLSGEALTSLAGQLPFPAAVGGKKIYLARMSFSQSTGVGGILIVDRLWQNSGLSVTAITSQTVNSVAFPARDRNGSTNGEGVNIAMEVTTALGSGTPTITIGYTNSAGVSGRTGTIGPLVASSTIGTFLNMTLQDGDLGVRSVQTFQSSATMTAGAVSLVAYRQISSIGTLTAGYMYDRDAVSLGLPALHDNSVPQLLYSPASVAGTSVSGQVVWAQG